MTVSSDWSDKGVLVDRSNTGGSLRAQPRSLAGSYERDQDALALVAAFGDGVEGR
jgi:hypothetical protein